eukprot:scaffold16556_cov63-Phaeocystis_antarctica.AAC.5
MARSVAGRYVSPPPCSATPGEDRAAPHRRRRPAGRGSRPPVPWPRPPPQPPGGAAGPARRERPPRPSHAGARPRCPSHCPNHSPAT